MSEKKRVTLSFIKAGKTTEVNIEGPQKSIDRLTRSLKKDSSVDSFEIIDNE